MLTMIKKEFKDILKSYKLLIVPIAFTLITLMSPLSTYFLPTILKNTSDLPQGMVIEMGDVALADILRTFFTDIPQITLIAIILLTMGLITTERLTGSCALVLSKPISSAAYFLSKGICASILILCSYFIANLISIYYCSLLMDGINIRDSILGIISVLPVILLIISISMFLSSFIKSTIAVGGLTFAANLAIFTAPKMISDTIYSLSPSKVIENASAILIGNNANNLFPPILTCFLISLTLFLLGAYIFIKQEF